MQISFRQGIINTPSTFLSYNLSGHIDLIIPVNNNVSFTIADNNNNYMYMEKATITNAWTGPFVARLTYWLYWDIDVNTGIRTFGATIHAPIVNAIQPISPINDQHWYDSNNDNMFVWNGTRWIKKLRVFAARMTNNNTFISLSINAPLFTGTQVGDTSINKAGYIVYDITSAHPIKKYDGTFFTTEDTVLIGMSSTAQLKFSSILIQGIANTSLSAYSIVRFSDFNVVSQVTNYTIDNSAYGMIEVDVTYGNTVNVVMDGIITNTDWDWSLAGINAPLYVDNNGQLTTTLPVTPIVVATVVDRQSILLRPSSLFVNTQNDPASTTNMGAVTLSSSPDDINIPIAVGVNDVQYLSTVAHLSDNISHLSPTEQTLITDMLTPNNTVTLDIKNVIANNYKSNGITLVDNSGIIWDMSLGVFASITLTASTTLAAPTNLPINTIITLIIIQDSVGLRNVTFDSVFNWAGGSAPNIGATSGSTRSILTFISDGISLFEVSRSINIS